MTIGELDVVGLEVAPALDFRLVAVLREALKVFRGDLFSRDALSGELLADKRISGHRTIKAPPLRRNNTTTSWCRAPRVHIIRLTTRTNCVNLCLYPSAILLSFDHSVWHE
jgi:hypothetical protein